MNKAQYRFISQERMCEKISNTYESVMVAAREARRINAHLKMVGTEDERGEKVTSLALDRLMNDEINYNYKASKDDGGGGGL